MCEEADDGIGFVDAYMHNYYSSCAFMHNFTPNDVGVFLVKICKMSCFLYFARLSMD